MIDGRRFAHVPVEVFIDLTVMLGCVLGTGLCRLMRVCPHLRNNCSVMRSDIPDDGVAAIGQYHRLSCTPRDESQGCKVETHLVTRSSASRRDHLRTDVHMSFQNVEKMRRHNAEKSSTVDHARESFTVRPNPLLNPSSCLA